MTTSELERRLAAVLDQHAEDAMNETRTDELLTRFEADTERQAKRRRKGWAAGGLVAVAAAAALIAWLPGTVSRDSQPAPPAQERGAEQTAAAFVDAYGSFDRERAASYLADDAVLDLWVDQYGDDHWQRGNRWLEAVQAKFLLDSCDTIRRSSEGTYVSCAYKLHAFGSDQLGKGPYDLNTFSFAVKDGKIVEAGQVQSPGANGFGQQMWGPFVDWVSKAYPRDAAVMYADWPVGDVQSETPRSIELWRKHVEDYVETHAGGGTG
ncbi:hypothetical protein EKO23_03575 [Nocardioides guangzhouensis]|uniref:Uncharacterized protein n=1 Tax=Nocardioides guangzhouensis TaxID=2497878 RepID=A0A4Q4ZLK5_9ACTN|nr:hypothetical protein [Nocardioides guangzhouensis]RYP88416.1 hypothetical protein EKO23_03575 [Nocardioides guangzhouensis]